ncbi:MAG: hypothetical protein RR637_02925, partial [Clostridium sp.]
FDEDLSDSVIREVDVDKTNKKVNATYTIKANIQEEVGSKKKNVVIAIDAPYKISSDTVLRSAIEDQLLTSLRNSTGITDLNVGIVTMEEAHALTKNNSKLYTLKHNNIINKPTESNNTQLKWALDNTYSKSNNNLGDGLRLAYSNVKATSVYGYLSDYNPNDFEKYVIFIGSGDANYYTQGQNKDSYYYGTASDGSGLNCPPDSFKGKEYFKDISTKISNSKAGKGDVEFTTGDKNIKSFVVGLSLANKDDYNYVANSLGTTLKESLASDSTTINNIFKGIADEIVRGSVVTPPTTNNITTTLSSKISLEEQLSDNLKLDTTSLNGITSTSIAGGVKLSGLPIQSAVANSKGGYDVVSKFTVSYTASNVTPTSSYILGNNHKSNVTISTTPSKTLKLSKYEFTFDDVKRYNISNNGSEITIKYKIKPGKESVGDDSKEIARIQELETNYGYPQGRVVFEEYIKSNLKVKEVIPVTEGLKFNIDNLGGKVYLNPVLTEYKIQSSGDYAICKSGTDQNLSELEFDVVYTLNGYYPFSVGSKSVSGGNIFNSYALYEKSSAKAYKQSLGNQNIEVNATSINSVGLLKKSSSTDLTKYVDSTTNKIDVANTGSVINFAMITDIKSQIPDVRVVVDFFKGTTKMTSSVFSDIKVTNITSDKLTVKGASSQVSSMIRVSFSSIKEVKELDKLNNFKFTHPKATDTKVLENGALINQVVPEALRYLDNVIIKVPKGATKAVITVYDEYGNSTTKKLKEYTLTNNSGSAASK